MERGDYNETDLADIQGDFDDEMRAFQPEGADGLCFVDGVQYESRTEIVDVTPDCFDEEGAKTYARAVLPVMPIETRAFTYVSPNIDQEHDMILPVFGGFGETSAQGDNHFLEDLLRKLQQKGYKNPLVIGMNPCGRATKEYSENLDGVAKIGLQDELNDVRLLTYYLWERGFLDGEGEICPIGHSMGSFNTMAFMEAMKEIEHIAAMRLETHAQVSKVIHLMPVSDKPRAFLHPSFVARIFPFIRKSLSQAWLSKKGGLDVSAYHHNRMMFGGKETQLDHMHWRRGADDSATRFLGLAFNKRRIFDVRELFRGKEYFQFIGMGDRLIPASIQDNWFKHVVGIAEVKDSDYIEGDYHHHSIPFNMTQDQRSDLRDFWSRVFGTEVDNEIVIK